ncbi:hypothetical protein A7K91_21325 [Paenibacillus oryzae]|uniref:Glycosyl transferase family 1 n=1 Tax=Paenibacillus oryzae TaxID=1844972 RepID=A0A1A5YS91_9BACL|nr:glycosyltransferase family 1 protein [Paenibacillus oryzae]OBR68424.1 hypothetical protein A7K91_21325 [Paenibacillus oryzae]
MKLRVLHVFGRLDRGGAETMIMNIYRKIDRSCIQFDFVIHTKERCEYNDEIESLGGEIHNIPAYKGLNHHEYVKSWNDLFSKNQYLIVHGHVRSTALIYLSIAKKYDIKIISHSHSTSSGKGINGIIKKIYQHPIRYVTKNLLACSNEAGIWLFGARTKFKVINNGIDIKQFEFNKDVREKIRSDLELNHKFVIGHVGRFDPSKNHFFMLEVFKEICDEVDNAILLLVGDGPLRTQIEQYARDIQVYNRVIFTGSTGRVSEYYQAMDVFLFPSRYEGLGMTVVEAQSAGLRCVISDGIPQEVVLTNLVDVVPLKHPPNIWAKIVSSYIDSINRPITYKEIKSKGYDVEDCTSYLKQYYLSLVQ